MGDLRLFFGLSLTRWDRDFRSQPKGPLFHRWLPDGRATALVLEDEDKSYKLEMWFERRGYMDGQFIRYDDKRREVDENTIPRQAVLDAGVLRGEILVRNVSSAELEAVVQGRTGDPEYVGLGKRVVKSILDPALCRLTRLLRVQFGQHWLEVHNSFDSRQHSLGQHCNLLNMRWSVNGNAWTDFVPDKPENAPLTIVMNTRVYKELLTRQDWARLQNLLSSGFEPRLATTLAARAHELLDVDRFRHALLEAASALEIAIQERLRFDMGRETSLLTAVQSFWDLPLPARMIAVSARLVSDTELQKAVDAIARRNAIIHEGLESTARDGEMAQALLVVVEKLIPGPASKFPVIPNTNHLSASPEDWDTTSS